MTVWGMGVLAPCNPALQVTPVTLLSISDRLLFLSATA